MKIWTAWTISIKGNSILFTCQLKPLWRFRNSLKAKDSITKYWHRLLLTKVWTELKGAFLSLAKDTLFTQDEFNLIKCLRTIRIHMFQDQGNSSNSLLTLPDVSLSSMSWIETR